MTTKKNQKANYVHLPMEFPDEFYTDTLELRFTEAMPVGKTWKLLSEDVKDKSWQLFGQLKNGALTIARGNGGPLPFRTIGACFANFPVLREVWLDGLDLSNTTEIEGTFRNCPALETIHGKDLDLGKLVKCRRVFMGCKNLQHFDVTIKNDALPNLTTIRWLFANTGFRSIDMSGVSAPKLTDVRSVAWKCENMVEFVLPKNAPIMKMDRMVGMCKKLLALDLTTLNSAPTSIRRMAVGNESMTTVLMPNVTIGKETDTFKAFEDCWRLRSVDLAGLHIDPAESRMFKGTYIKRLGIPFPTSTDTDGLINLIGTMSALSHELDISHATQMELLVKALRNAKPRILVLDASEITCKANLDTKFTDKKVVDAALSPADIAPLTAKAK